MVRMCYKFIDDSEEGDESCYLDFWINLRLRVSYILLYFSIVHLAQTRAEMNGT